MSTLQNQISGCERNIQQSLAQCAEMAGEKNFQFIFSLDDFVNGITACNLDNTLDSMSKVLELFQECDRIITIEEKRRNYTRELQKIIANREKKETVKRLTTQHSFKKKAIPFKILTPPSSQDSMDIQDKDDF